MSKASKILLAQINPTVGDIFGNLIKIRKIISENQHKHDLILFPELVLSGYPIEDLLFRPSLHAQIQQALQEIVAVSKNCYVIIGHPSIEHGHYYNSASIIYNGKIIACYHKQKLPNYGVFDELRYYTPGEPETCIIEINDCRFGLCICEDMWQPGPVEALKACGVQALLCINASPFDYEKYERRESLVKSYALQGMTVFYVNLVGGQDDLLFDGQSMVIDAHGHIKARLPAFDECLQTITFSPENVTGLIAPILAEDELIYKALVTATHDYVTKNGFKGVLLGLSGGIDSALTLAIAVDALGKERVQAVMMPSRHTAPISEQDADLQIKTMGVKSTELSIEPVYKAFLSTLAHEFKGLPQDTTEENIQARVRGVLLMALSNKSGRLVLTTSNKSEAAVGYATLYGDMAGGFSVLKDVLKTQVYQLAHYRNSVKKVIPDRVLTRAPSAELSPNQTDQDCLPDYAILDAIIKGYMEFNLDCQSLINQGLPEKEVKRVIQLIKRNEFKRRQSAPGPKISRRAYGKDWRFPITDGLKE